MINVAIAGTFTAINRHINALSKTKDVRITGCWITNALQDTVVDMETGLTSAHPGIIADKADAIIITEGGNFSKQLTTLALRKAKHVFLYPATLQTINDVYSLVKLAREANVILKCGKTGKSNVNGLLKALPELNDIGFIDIHHAIRLSRTGVTSDLYHVVLADAELISCLNKARNTLLKAKGVCLRSPHPEMINARLEFDNGSAVNYYCNTVDVKNEHVATIVLKDSVFKYNLIKNELTGWHIKHAPDQNENPIFIETIQVEQTDNLYDDLSAFFNLIRSGPAFLSIYDNGFESLVLTDRLLERVLKPFVQIA
jgi:hypothetical protein